MSGVLVLGEISAGGELRASTLELIGAGLALGGQGAGAVSVALVGSDPRAHVAAVDVAGVEEIVLVRSEGYEAHVMQAALTALIEARNPAVVIAGHTPDSLGFVAAVAARKRLGFASEVTAATWGQTGLLVRRPAYGGRLIAELDFPDKETVLLLLRGGAFAPAATGGGGGAEQSQPAVELAGSARSERLELREPPAGDVDIAKADFLVSIGRGVGEETRIGELERLAQRLGATLSASGPPVEAGWVARTRKVGQSGRTVAPRVYLALGISGAPQHLAGMSKARTIIAVNTDPDARIFDVAHYGAVADLFEVAAAIERRLA
ncbi:MAG: electron transfer flavoprotein subunit alpha/FixB family protein [Solirubrobacteraceae bacterium]